MSIPVVALKIIDFRESAAVTIIMIDIWGQSISSLKKPTTETPATGDVKKNI